MTSGPDIQRILGIHSNRISHVERVVSILGALVGIGLVYLASAPILDQPPVLLASMGASAVLLFAVPHGALSQPWPVLGGHLVSAAVGVACARWIEAPALAAPVAVAAAVGAMHYLRCIHPPGGATALAAVIGGPAVGDLGFGYLLAPVGLNVVLLVAAAVAFNAFFPWRRYPVGLAPPPVEPEPDRPGPRPIAHEDFVYALSEIDTFVDIDESDLVRIYELATRPPSARQPPPLRLHRGACYSNARDGNQWGVRQVVQVIEPESGPQALVVYRTLAGFQTGTTHSTTLAEFQDWARHEVYRDDGAWRRVREPTGSG